MSWFECRVQQGVTVLYLISLLSSFIICFLDCQEPEPDNEKWQDIRLEHGTTGYPIHPHALTSVFCRIQCNVLFNGFLKIVLQHK